ALALFLALLAQPARAASLEQDLLAQAPRLITHLQDKGCKNVGVLKFLIYKGDSALTDNAGPLNLGLAQRLEIALALANPVEEAKLTADADVGNLTDGGESYLLRDPKSLDKLELDKAQQAAARVKAREATFPLLDEAAPVTLEVLYDGKEAPLKAKDGRAEVAEPT